MVLNGLFDRHEVYDLSHVSIIVEEENTAKLLQMILAQEPNSM